MTAIVVALVGVLSVAITGAVTFLVARRQMSGRVETTEAGKLWDEAENIRKALRDDVIELRKEAEVLRGELGVLRAQIVHLRRQAARAQAHVKRCEEQLARLREGL